MSWRARWAAAQITPVLVSSFVWLLFCGLISATWLAGVVGFAAVMVASRTSRAGLWIRFGVRPATATERDSMLAALGPVASLRGRGQPRVWVGLRRVDVHVVSPRHLLINHRLLLDAAAARVSGGQVCAAACCTLGQSVPAGSAPVRAVELYCTPWRIINRVVGALSYTATRLPLVGFAWTIRPAVFVLAAVNAYTTGPVFWREVVAASVLTVLVLTYTTPVLRRRWESRLQELGDARVIAEGFGVVWAGMLHDASTDSATIRRFKRLTTPRAADVPPRAGECSHAGADA